MLSSTVLVTVSSGSRTATLTVPSVGARSNVVVVVTVRLASVWNHPTPCAFVVEVPAAVEPPDERPDAQYPFVLITGRQLEHWHTGGMTRRATVLDALEPIATASMCQADLQRLDLSPGDVITIQSRRGEVAIHVRRDDGTPPGAVFVPFAYYEAAANLMTNAALDPFGKIPEFKYCAVRLTRGGTPAAVAGYSREVQATTP